MSVNLVIVEGWNVQDGHELSQKISGNEDSARGWFGSPRQQDFSSTYSESSGEPGGEGQIPNPHRNAPHVDSHDRSSSADGKKAAQTSSREKAIGLIWIETGSKEGMG